MEVLKKSYEPVTTLGLFAALGYAPKLVQDKLFDLLLSRATAVMTNVPGPQNPLYQSAVHPGTRETWTPPMPPIRGWSRDITRDGSPLDRSHDRPQIAQSTTDESRSTLEAILTRLAPGIYLAHCGPEHQWGSPTPAWSRPNASDSEVVQRLWTMSAVHRLGPRHPAPIPPAVLRHRRPNVSPSKESR